MLGVWGLGFYRAQDLGSLPPSLSRSLSLSLVISPPFLSLPCHRLGFSAGVRLADSFGVDGFWAGFKALGLGVFDGLVALSLGSRKP